MAYQILDINENVVSTTDNIEEVNALLSSEEVHAFYFDTTLVADLNANYTGDKSALRIIKHIEA